MVLLGLGVGIAFNPVLLAAMGDVDQQEAGLASGTVNTSFMLDGALGLAILVSVSAWRSGELTASGAPALVAVNGGFPGVSPFPAHRVANCGSRPAGSSPSRYRQAHCRR